MQRIVLGRAMLAVTLYSGLSVAQTLRQRLPAGDAADRWCSYIAEAGREHGACASDDADERRGGDTDQGGAGFGGAGSQRGAGDPRQDCFSRLSE